MVSFKDIYVALNKLRLVFFLSLAAGRLGLFYT